MSEKLDCETAKEWQLTNVDGRIKTMDFLRQFRERRARALEASSRQPEMKGETIGIKNVDSIKDKSEHYQSYQSNSFDVFFLQTISSNLHLSQVPHSSNCNILPKYDKA